jgi:hypothetical protein
MYTVQVRVHVVPRCTDVYTVEFMSLLLKIFILQTAYHLCFSPFIDDGTLASGDASFMRDALSRTFQLVIFWYFVSYTGLSSEMNDFYQAHKTFKIKRVLLISHVQNYCVLF